MLTSGFFNSVSGDRVYNATQINSMFDGIIHDGIFTSVYDEQGNRTNPEEGFGEGFAVVPSGDSTQPFKIRIKSGKAWLNHTWSINDSVETLTVPAAPVGTATRIDMVALEVNRSAAVRANSFVLVQGTAANTPTRPVPTGWSNGARVEGEVQQYPLAWITVYGTGHNSYTGIISSSVIDNTAKGSAMTPFVVNITNTWNAQTLYDHWNGQFTQWFTATQSSFNTWFSTSQASFTTFMTNSTTTFNTFMTNKGTEFTTFINTKTSDFESFINTKTSEFNTFMDDNEDEFDEWFLTVKNKITTDLGPKLTLAVLTTSTKTITPSDWTAVGNPVNYYKHTVAVENLDGDPLTSDARVEIYLDLAGSDYSTASDKIKQYGYIYAAEFDATRTHITLYSRALPTHNLPIGFVGALLDT